MPGSAASKPNPRPSGRSRRRGANRPVSGLLRYSHIFASTVREFLELKLLREVSSDALSLSQFHLLKLICADGPHQVGEAADFLGVSAPAASKNIDKMERLGLVTREHSVGDRRAVFLAPTPKARALVARYARLEAERFAPVLRVFTGDELEQFEGLLERFSLGLIAAEDSSEGVCLRCSAYYEKNCPVRRIRSGCPFQTVRDTRLEPAAAGSA